MLPAAAAGIAFAVDISATVKMDASLANDSGEDVEFLTIKNKDQKDSDALIFSASGEKAGGQFQVWYTYDGTEGKLNVSDVPVDENDNIVGQYLKIRKANIWVKPIDMLKITVGDVNLDSYKEHIFWWHGVYGEKPGSWGAFGGEYLAGAGAKVELTPIENLSIEAGIFAGTGKALFSTNDDASYGAFGLKAKYGFGPGSATVVFANKGKDADKIIGIGGDFTGVEGLYAMANLNFRLNNADGFVAFTLDDYVEYSLDAFKVQVHLPFSLFKVGDDFKTGLHATVKASYAMDAFTPYLLITNEPDGDKGWDFSADEFNFTMTFKPGVEFKVGEAAFNVGFRADVQSKAANDYDKFNWSVPVEISLGL